MKLRKNRIFDPELFLAQAGVGRTLIQLRKKQTLFSQGDAADAVFYIQKGKIKLSIISKCGKEATLTLLGAGDFVVVECEPAALPMLMTTATAIAECVALRIMSRTLFAV